MNNFRSHNLLLAIILVALFSCKHENKPQELKTESGYKYVLLDESKNGVHPKLGDYVTIQMQVINSKDSVIFNTERNKLPFRTQLQTIPFKGSYEDGLRSISEGDSAEFYVPSDSLYRHFYTGHALDSFPQSKSPFAAGSFTRFRIRLLKVQTAEKAELEQQIAFSERAKNEESFTESFTKRNHFDVKDSSGYYLMYKEHGKGTPVKKGMRIKIDFVGATLDGKVFQNTTERKTPYEFVFGKDEIIKGFELTFPKLRQGDHVSIVMPSKLGYGEEGLRNPRDGTYIIPPYSPLIFDIKFLEVGNFGSTAKK